MRVEVGPAPAGEGSDELPLGAVVTDVALASGSAAQPLRVRRATAGMACSRRVRSEIIR